MVRGPFRLLETGFQTASGRYGGRVNSLHNGEVVSPDVGRVPVLGYVDNRIRIDSSELTPEALADVGSHFEYPNTTPRERRKPGDPEVYVTWQRAYVEGRSARYSLTFPRGVQERLALLLERHNYELGLADERTWCNAEPDFPDHARELWAHQTPLVRAAIEGGSGLILAPTGSGKTTVMMALAAKLKRRTLAMVWTGNLLKQWRERAIDELGYLENEIGIVGDGEYRVRALTLAMQQTIYRRFEDGDMRLATEFDVVIADEVQRFAAETLFASIDPFTARYRIGTSADETRKDGKEFLVHDLFGSVLARCTEKETLDAGKTVEVEMCLVPTEFKAPWYRYRQDFNRLLAEMCSDEQRNATILKMAGATAQQGQQVLLFTHRVEHARMMDQKLTGLGVKSGTLLGGADEAVAFDRTRKGMLNGEYRAGVGTYQAIAQGTDIPGVSRGIAMTPIANNPQQVNQVRGRICRSSEGKSFGRLALMYDRHVYGAKPVRNMVERYRIVRVWDGQKWADGATWLKGTRRPAA